jgi:hypothetical protein
MSGTPTTLAALAAAGACALALALAPAREAAAQTSFPAFQALEGNILSSTATKPIAPASTDEMIVINLKTGRRESVAFSVSSVGDYILVISKDSSFNGTLLELRLRKGGDVFALVKTSDGSPAQFAFVGSIFAERLEFDVRIGARISSSTQLPPSTPPGGEPAPTRPVNTNPEAVDCLEAAFDVNSDTKCDEADIDLIQAFLRANPPGPERTPIKPSPPEDVNGDGFVNVRDLLDAVRALQRARVDAARKGVRVEGGEIDRPKAPARPTSDAAAEIEAARKKARERPQ